MHELAKTGRWLGGTTPTGYASESVKSITVDGKTKKACKLKLLPDEAEIIYKIFDLYEQYDSLTMTETELLRQGIKTKTGRSFTRFSIKSILQNPVYLIADKDAYQYFVDNEAELFAPESDFDGVRGVLAYNRSDQEKGRATVYNPISEWIVSVGEHPGIISSNRWIRVQESLERNKSKSYHKSRGNEALLTGLLWCSCGSRMHVMLLADDPEKTVLEPLSARKDQKEKVYDFDLMERGGHIAGVHLLIDGQDKDLAADRVILAR